MLLTNLHYYPKYKGQMYRIENSMVDLNVTAEHRMYVSKLDHDSFELINSVE
jgi:hypothetical protein